MSSHVQSIAFLVIGALVAPVPSHAVPPKLSPAQRSEIRTHFRALDRALLDERLSPKLRSILTVQKRELARALKEVTAGRARAELGADGRTVSLLRGPNRIGLIENRVLGGRHGAEDLSFSRLYDQGRRDVDIRERGDGRKAVRHRKLDRPLDPAVYRNLHLAEIVDPHGATRGEESRAEFSPSGIYPFSEALTVRYQVTDGKRTRLRDVLRDGLRSDRTWVSGARSGDCLIARPREKGTSRVGAAGHR